MQRGIVAIPKSVHKERLAENINIFDFELSKEDFDYVFTFERNGRTCAESWLADHPFYPFHDEY